VMCISFELSSNMSYFVTDNSVSLRLGTDISLHAYSEISSSVIGKNKHYRLGLIKTLLRKKRRRPNTHQTCQHLEQFFCFSGKS